LKTPHKVARLAKFLSYILGRRPDEFGLMPDRDGYFKIKDLLKALSEETGWSYARRSHLQEVLLTCSQPDIEIDNERIRASTRTHLPPLHPAADPPKLLYTCIRRRAYPRVHDRGIAPVEDAPVVLATLPELALRMGRRKDPDPVLLTVNTAQGQASGSVYHQFGKLLYTTDFVAAGTFSGPPLPKEPPATGKSPATEPPRPAVAPGSFILDPQRAMSPQPGKSDRRKQSDWKRERRQQRRHKQKKMWEE
jgi:putative RNA 2'-phosphotransferase